VGPITRRQARQSNSPESVVFDVNPTPKDIWDEIEDDAFQRSEDAKAPRPSPPYTVVSGEELLGKELAPEIHIWGQGLITAGKLTAVIGQGGTGKSRLMMQIAVEQTAGLNALGFKATDEIGPQKWLFVGTENGTHRLQNEFRTMVNSLATEEQKQTAKIHCFFHILEQDDDGDIMLREDNEPRWAALLRAVNPDVVCVDPFGDLHPGDINKPAEVRATLAAFLRVCRKGRHDRAIVIVHHARAGKHNIAGAVGWDQGAFSLGAKDLTTKARVQLHVTFTDPDDWSRILLSMGKANDVPRFEPRGYQLNHESMRYEDDPDFDLEAWKADLDGKRHSATKLTPAELLDYIIRNGGPKNGEKRQWQEVAGEHFEVSARTVRGKIEDLIERKYLVVQKGGNLRVTDKYKAKERKAEDGL
jgi:hypothetical protein